MGLAVNQPSAEVQALRTQWSVLEALVGGTPAMRAGRTKYLPQWPNEEAESYNARLATATLFPMFRRTAGVMAGKPFSKALTLEGANARIEGFAENIDLQGVNLHTFAAEMFLEDVRYGLAGILVDYPDTTERDSAGRPVAAEQRARTVAQVESSGVRPYWVRVKHNQILGWRSEVVNGSLRLAQLRLLESVDDPDGQFGTETVDQVRVLYPGRWEIWRAEGNEWAIWRDGTTSLKEIPFVPLYGAREGFMIGSPPLLDLAYLNVKHWQSQSDQDTILHVARVPILAMFGADEQTTLTVGASAAVKFDNPNAKLEFVEHSGAAISAGADSLAALEEQAIQTGAELLVKRPGERTATESANDAEANKSDLQRMAEGFEDALDQALVYTAQFAGLPETEAGSVKLFSDYGAATLSDASASLIKELQFSGLLSKRTTLEEMKRRGVLSAEVDPDTEIATAEEEAVPMDGMTDADDQ